MHLKISNTGCCRRAGFHLQVSFSLYKTHLSNSIIWKFSSCCKKKKVKGSSCIENVFKIFKHAFAASEPDHRELLK